MELDILDCEECSRMCGLGDRCMAGSLSACRRVREDEGEEEVFLMFLL